MTSRSSTAVPILAAIAIVAGLLAAYVGGYFWLGTKFTWPSEDVWRIYPNAWQARLFLPGAAIESWLFRPIKVTALDEHTAGSGFVTRD
jgi:hypothetical protein